MSNPSVVIVDYGLGNLFSVARALKSIGIDPAISDHPTVVQAADRLILPGVGAFGEGMQNLRTRGLVPAINAYAASGRPILGVCLGMQLLMSESEEFGLHEGLDLIKGRVVRLQPPQGGDRFKVPHIGWDELYPPVPGRSAAETWDRTPLSTLKAGAFMYFLHSYVVVPSEPNRCLAVTRYGYDTFCSVVKQGHVLGTQFHPERSGEEGLRLYQRFVYGE